MTNIGEYFDGALIRGVDDGIGTGTVVSLQATPKSGDLELPEGGKGPVGPQGPPAYDFVWRGELADEAALAAQRPQMKPHHLGHAWRVVEPEILVFWDGTTFVTFTDAFGARGPTGAVNTLTMGTVTTGAVGSALVVTFTGSSPNQTLNLSIPRGGQGLKGKEGSPGPIVNAPDFDGTVTRTQGAIPQWDTTAEKWTPAPWPGFRGPWSITSGSFTSGTNVSTSPNTIATLPIPAQDVRWRPQMSGGVQILPVSPSTALRLRLEVRIGSAAGALVAVANALPYAVSQFPKLFPCSETTITPGDTAGTIDAGVATTLYVVIRRLAGSGNYTHSTTGAHVMCQGRPVVAP